MAADDVFTLLEDIPSDNDSVCSDDDQVDPENITANNNLLNLDDIPIIFADDIDMYQNIANQEDDDSIDSDPEMNETLAVIRSRELAKRTIWTTSTENCIRQRKTFSEATGPNIPDDLESPHDVFLHIFPLNLIEAIVFQTNLYALQKNGGNSNSFTATNVKEMKTFLGINILMGVKKLPSYCDYWSSRPELRDHFISSAMTRDRFAWILGHIHLADNSIMPPKGSDNYDKLYKIRLLLETLTETFKESYKPGKNQSIDKSMIRFKGRSTLKQYMPLKPIKRGYKVWIRADESGYVCQFQIYSGKVSDIAEKDLGARVVKDLSRDLVGKGHHIYFDNFFNSVQLEKDLQSDLIYACGTVRTNRKGLPADMKSDKDLPQRGDLDWRVSKDGLVFLKWKDRKIVSFLSNYHNPLDICSVPRKEKDGSSKDIPCPNIVRDYNAHMGYVDKMDMLKSIYEIDRKSKKWWHRVLWYFLDVSIVNSYILFKNRTESSTPNLKVFRISVWRQASLVLGSQHVLELNPKSQIISSVQCLTK